MSTATKSHGPATKGRRVPLAAKARPAALTLPVAYVATARPLRYGNYTLEEGVEVPGAADWLRLEAWVAARRIRPVFDEDYVAFDDFAARKDAEAEAAAAEAEATEAEATEKDDTEPEKASPTKE